MPVPFPAAYHQIIGYMLVPLAVWCTLASLELIAVRRAFRPGEALGPDLAALRRGRLVPAFLASRFCGPGALLTVLLLRLVAGVALPFVGAQAVMIALLALVIGCTGWVSVATGGSDGADKIALVACVAAALMLAGELLDDRRLCLIGLAWGAGQAMIAYATSGIAKLARGFWRDGTALAAAMTSYRSGHPVAAAIVRHRDVAATLAWAIMLLEALSPLALLAPPALCLSVLAALALFHVATAFAMGLNTYPWAFAATYPCLWMANRLLHFSGPAG